MLSVPAQMVLAAVAVVWVAQVEQALVATARGHRQALTHQLANQAYELSSILQLIVSGSLARLSRISVSCCTFQVLCVPGLLTLGRFSQTTSLATSLVHCRDVVTRLASSQAASPSDFEWESQVRLVWERDDTAASSLHALCCDATLEYGYEYLGCQSRLVVTPLTDRCRITLCQVQTVCPVRLAAANFSQVWHVLTGSTPVHGRSTSGSGWNRQDRDHQGLGACCRPPGVCV